MSTEIVTIPSSNLLPGQHFAMGNWNEAKHYIVTEVEGDITSYVPVDDKSVKPKRIVKVRDVQIEVYVREHAEPARRTFKPFEAKARKADRRKRKRWATKARREAAKNKVAV